MRARIRRLPLALALLLAAAPLRPQPPDPLQPAGSGGIATVERALARLDQHRRLMIVAAHPDDEDTTLLALVSRGEGGEAAYLSLTRGEGGQNLIGDELGEALGLLRSEELLAARRIDGARQLFTSAYDFGYTESLEETFARWPREELLREVVAAIRRFRPQVLVAVFPPGERAGHGQHQASGVLAEEAFRLAGDPLAFPQLAAAGLGAWQPLLLYREAWFDPQAATHELPSTVLDPLTGHTVFQLAMDGRSQHRSQSMGVMQALDGRPVRLTAVASALGGWAAAGEAAVPGTGGTGADTLGATPPAVPAPVPEATPAPPRDQRELFAGIDTRLVALADLVPEGARRERLRARLEEVTALVAEARRGLAPARLGEVVPLLAEIHGQLACARAEVFAPPAAAFEVGIHLDTLLTEKMQAAADGLAAAAGLVLDATTERSAWVPGETIPVAVRLWNGGEEPVEVQRVELRSPGWWWPTLGANATGPTVWTPETPVGPGRLLDHGFTLAIRDDAEPTVPYFLRQPRQGDRYDLATVPAELHGEPFEPPPALVRVEIALPGGRGPCGDAVGSTCDPRCGRALRMEREVVAISRDLASGERREPLRAVPAVEVALSPSLLVWPLDDRRPRRLRVDLQAHGGPRSGRVELALPEGWPPVAAQPFALQAEERASLLVDVEPPAELAMGRYELAATAIEERPLALAPEEVATEPGTAAQAAAPEATEPRTAEEIAEDDHLLGFEPPPAPAPTVREVAHRLAVPLIEYEHVRPRPFPVPSRSQVSAFPLALPPLHRVGYVRGAADYVPEALLGAGVPVELVEPAELATRDLAAYDALVIGSRAYDAAPELAAANPRLLDYLRGGGLVLVQFQRWDYFQQGLPPVPMTMERRGAGRTTDETAPVRRLVADHRVFSTPNPIEEGDWEGWVQERGLYYPQSWDGSVVPLLAMADPGREELTGALLVAPYGRGTYVYTGLAFFRQLPAGVPGAYRLFANLLALARPRVEAEDLADEELAP
jgi:LmbE family N-acetylglucosaminyl deacetylase